MDFHVRFNTSAYLKLESLFKEASDAPCNMFLTNRLYIEMMIVMYIKGKVISYFKYHKGVFVLQHIYDTNVSLYIYL